MIKINLYEYQVHELIILLKSTIHDFEEEKAKKENSCDLSFYEIKISILEKITNVFMDSLIKE